MSNKPDEATEEGHGSSAFQEDMDALIEGAAGLLDNLKDVFQKSREEVVRASQVGKSRIDVFQLRKEREHFVQRLGEEAYELLRSGRLASPGLKRAADKILKIDRKIEAYEDQIAKLSEEMTEPAKKEPAKKEPAKKAPAKKAPAKKAPAKKATTKKAATKKAPAKKAATKKAPAKKAAAKKAAGKKAAAKKAPAPRASKPSKARGRK